MGYPMGNPDINGCGDGRVRQLRRSADRRASGVWLNVP